ncbi:superinfection exclusion B family protein [Agrobacterium tumefaciens]|uniref:superinfection exclusion B family protein n=1 Tax=Agrobacterium tumefaciens TaxID=358 RepID=UPI0022435057|nr:superinfection exclusion B family protein [Agrobacterium tumefaciens]MCW8057501.1 superinfection exclusion B family protein [Agrobacterium tumefaciens]MCW8146782.1 superinfection exclusion B family protein [Agrobacterium tumefaciens]
MPEWLTSAFSLTREISSKIALPVFITSTAILFSPDQYARTIGIDGLRNDYRILIGFFFLLSLAALTTNSIWWVAAALKPMVKDQVFIFLNKSVLKDLTNDEKAILRRFIRNGESTVGAEISNGTMNLLEHKRVVARSSNIAIRFTTFPWILQPWAREYLTKHPDLLD